MLFGKVGTSCRPRPKIPVNYLRFAPVIAGFLGTAPFHTHPYTCPGGACHAKLAQGLHNFPARARKGPQAFHIFSAQRISHAKGLWQLVIDDTHRKKPHLAMRRAMYGACGVSTLAMIP
jgi:hypothetical protein